jgi:hypothetical protein
MASRMANPTTLGPEVALDERRTPKIPTRPENNASAMDMEASKLIQQGNV